MDPRHRDRRVQKEYEVKRGTVRPPAEDKGRPWTSRSTSHQLQLGGEAWGWLFPKPSEGSVPMLDVELLACGTMSQDIPVVFGTQFSALCFGSLC